jgi:hypothetical protein
LIVAVQLYQGSTLHTFATSQYISDFLGAGIHSHTTT